MRITKENVNNFIKGLYMNCSNSNITHIDYIPNSIMYLYCRGNKLVEIPELPEYLIYLDVSFSWKDNSGCW